MRIHLINIPIRNRQSHNSVTGIHNSCISSSSRIRTIVYTCVTESHHSITIFHCVIWICTHHSIWICSQYSIWIRAHYSICYPQSTTTRIRICCSSWSSAFSRWRYTKSATWSINMRTRSLFPYTLTISILLLGSSCWCISSRPPISVELTLSATFPISTNFTITLRSVRSFSKTTTLLSLRVRNVYCSIHESSLRVRNVRKRRKFWKVLKSHLFSLGDLGWQVKMFKTFQNFPLSLISCLKSSRGELGFCGLICKLNTVSHIIGSSRWHSIWYSSSWELAIEVSKFDTSWSNTVGSWRTCS